MKRLVISLLRLGDILMMAPALRSIKKQNPNDELHLLINSNFSQVKDILPFVDKIHCFPRSRMQNLLGSIDTPILGAYDQLDEFFHHLERESFNEIYNFTHTNLSANVASLFNAKTIYGLHISESGQPVINGDWFKILNRPAEKMPWHFSEVFLRAVGDESFQSATFPGSKVTKIEERVLIQPFTSESRKQWDVKNWKQLLQSLLEKNQKLACEVLAAPFELEKVESFIEDLCLPEFEIRPYVCDLKSALERIRQSQILVTVDTSIKHLASSTDIKLIELALGGSRPEHTGTFRDNVLVLKSSSDSPLDVEILDLCEKYISDQKMTSFSGNHIWEAFITKVTDAGSWTLFPLSTNLSRNDVDEQVGQYLDIFFEYDGTEESMGSKAYSVTEILKSQNSPETWKRMAHQISESESKCEKTITELDGIKRRFQSILKNPEDIGQESQFLSSLVSYLGPISVRNGLVKSGNVIDYGSFAEVSRRLKLVQKKQEYTKRFLRTVKLQIMESI